LSDNGPSTENALRESYAEWMGSLARHDPSFVEETLDENFVLIDYAGNRSDRDEYRALYDALDPDHEATHEFTEFEVRELGDTAAVVTGAYTGESRFRNGLQLTMHIRFSSVWSQEQGTWRCVLHHISAANGGAGFQAAGS
jgi:ketosteroid isomerase-like protein